MLELAARLHEGVRSRLARRMPSSSPVESRWPSWICRGASSSTLRTKPPVAESAITSCDVARPRPVGPGLLLNGRPLRGHNVRWLTSTRKAGARRSASSMLHRGRTVAGTGYVRRAASSSRAAVAVLAVTGWDVVVVSLVPAVVAPIRLLPVSFRAPAVGHRKLAGTPPTAVAAIDRTPLLGDGQQGVDLRGQDGVHRVPARRLVHERAHITEPGPPPMQPIIGHALQRPRAAVAEPAGHRSVDTLEDQLVDLGGDPRRKRTDQPQPALPRTTASSMACALMASVSWPISARAGSSCQSRSLAGRPGPGRAQPTRRHSRSGRSR